MASPNYMECHGYYMSSCAYLSESLKHMMQTYVVYRNIGYTHTHARTHAHTHAHARTHARTHTHTHTHTRTHTHMHTRTCSYSQTNALPYTYRLYFSLHVFYIVKVVIFIVRVLYLYICSMSFFLFSMLTSFVRVFDLYAFLFSC